MSKIILLTQPPSYWKTCFIDDIASVTENFQFEDIDVVCEKNFSLVPSKISGYEPVINFDSIDSNQSWRGANNSTFPLSFFNSKKFNFEHHKLITEGAAATSIMVVKDQLSKHLGNNIICLICGGNIDAELFSKIIQ